MLAIDYLSQGDKDGALECQRNVLLANKYLNSQQDPFRNLQDLQTQWEGLMDYFASQEVAEENCKLLRFPHL
jgi:hypothetical protein